MRKCRYSSSVRRAAPTPGPGASPNAPKATAVMARAQDTMSARARFALGKGRGSPGLLLRQVPHRVGRAAPQFASPMRTRALFFLKAPESGEPVSAGAELCRGDVEARILGFHGLGRVILRQCGQTCQDFDDG